MTSQNYIGKTETKAELGSGEHINSYNILMQSQKIREMTE